MFRGIGYVGTGVIGEISKSRTEGRLVCQILDHVAFSEALPLRRPDGYYWEADVEAGRLNVFWSQGVRPLDQRTFDDLLAAAMPTQAAPAVHESTVRKYPSSEVALAVDDYAMRIALNHAGIVYKGQRIKRMPINNPGFDILIGDPSAPSRYLEVKGTRASQPLFFLSEGERRFSAGHADAYTLIVISGINLKRQTHTALTTRHGEITIAGCELAPMQWGGCIPASEG